jgi:serine/threonine protein phosphatase PrpC
MSNAEAPDMFLMCTEPIWQPMPDLRFVRRMVTSGELGAHMTILQQAAKNVITGTIIWRDVPLVQEEQQ